MSRISNRIATIGAALAIVLLVILLVILWSDVCNVDRIENLGRIRKNTTADGVVNETRRKQIDLRITTTDLVATFESIEQNLTNEGESQLSIYLYLLLTEKQTLLNLKYRIKNVRICKYKHVFPRYNENLQFF